MDGYDEISSIHADKAAVILSELMKTEVKRVCVTSRPVEKERRERKLSVFFSMKKLSRYSNTGYLKQKEKESGLVNFICRRLRLLNRLGFDENFTCCPLCITMIATVYEWIWKRI